MKDRNFIIFLVCITTVLAFITLGSYTYNLYNKNKAYESKERKNEKIQQEIQEQEKLKANKQAEYDNFLIENVYDNNIPIGFYVFDGVEYVKTNELYCNWSKDRIFGKLYTIPSNEERIQGIEFKRIFKDNWDKQDKAYEYKIGYNIKLQLDTGEVIDKRILEPKDTDELSYYIQFYLYDDLTNRNYYAIAQEELLDETMLTSVKLIGDKEIKGVNGPIELTVFTYNGEEDFDSNTGKYLGNSTFTTKIYREKI